MDQKWLDSLQEGEAQARHARAEAFAQQKATLLAEHRRPSTANTGGDPGAPSSTWTLETRLAYLGYPVDALEHAFATAICQVRFLTYEGRPAPTTVRPGELAHPDRAMLDTVASRQDRAWRAMFQARRSPETDG
jgi:hypothetical protein